ncbi:hypothetical protein HK102_008458 [Quaeritorhiza haematococci]|nr:hypothetical protein HK102_008458 [Quaeritorhiza haematococci]
MASLIQNARNFSNFLPFPITKPYNTVLAVDLKEEEHSHYIVEQAKSARTVVHADVVALIEDFLRCKRENGTDTEQFNYQMMESATNSGLLVTRFIRDRLVTKRPFVFCGQDDLTMMRNDTAQEPLAAHWDMVGKDSEGKLKMRDYLSYDEMALSALLSLSTQTCFINDGSRNNAGQKYDEESQPYQEEGVVIYLVGARFERLEHMDARHLLIQPDLTTEVNGYGREGVDGYDRKNLAPFARFYGQPVDIDTGVHYFPSYAEVTSLLNNENEDPQEQDIASEAHLNFINVIETDQGPIYLHAPLYRKRMRIMYETLFLEANARALEAQFSDESIQSAHVHVVAPGLGAWAINRSVQGKLIAEVILEALQTLPLPFISDVFLAWFEESAYEVEGLPSRLDEDVYIRGLKGNTIRVQFTKQAPATKLSEEKLLVATCAGDSNSLPGNIFWVKNLTASGDPAMASCSFVGEFLNPFVNPCVNNQIVKVKVSSTGLNVLSMS